MKIRHRVPVEELMKPDPITPEYQREVDRSTQKAERAYWQAQRELDRIERQLERERQKTARRAPRARKRRYIAELEALVELRRIGLERLHRLMVASPQSAQHRGTTSHRHVPAPGVI